MGPASTIIEKCGGHETVANWLGVDASRVYRWTYPKSRNGSDGYIPSQYHQTLLLKAREEGKDLRPEDFFPAYEEKVSAPQRESAQDNHARPAREKGGSVQSRGMRSLMAGGG